MVLHFYWHKIALLKDLELHQIINVTTVIKGRSL